MFCATEDKAGHERLMVVEALDSVVETGGHVKVAPLQHVLERSID